MLSVIVPFVNEHPQASFTIQNLFCELHHAEVDFEIIAIDNWCDEAAQQKVEVDPGVVEYRRKDGGNKYLRDIANNADWKFTLLEYTDKLSHWNAKNMGVRASHGDILFFVDAHCIVSPGVLPAMYRYYCDHHRRLDGTLHLPLSYFLERVGRQLIYKTDIDLEKGLLSYKFNRYAQAVGVFEVPCMSTCGMMMTRELYDWVGGWPKELGIYGGGENFLNYTLSILGKKKWIFDGPPLWHYAAKRGYNYRYEDLHRNRAIASFIVGGADFCRLYMRNVDGNQGILQYLAEGIIEKCADHRRMIEERQVISIQDWLKGWM